MSLPGRTKRDLAVFGNVGVSVCPSVAGVWAVTDDRRTQRQSAKAIDTRVNDCSCCCPPTACPSCPLLAIVIIIVIITAVIIIVIQW